MHSCDSNNKMSSNEKFPFYPCSHLPNSHPSRVLIKIQCILKPIKTKILFSFFIQMEDYMYYCVFLHLTMWSSFHNSGKYPIYISL